MSDDLGMTTDITTRMDLCDDLDALREALEYVRDHTVAELSGGVSFAHGYDPQRALDAIARVS